MMMLIIGLIAGVVLGATAILYVIGRALQDARFF